VAEVASSAPPFDKYVSGRGYGNVLDLLGAPFDVTLRGGNRCNADVGGDSTAANVSGFCVVWERVNSAADREIECATIDTQGVVGQVLNLSGPGSTLDGAPSISKWAEHLPGSDQTWCIAWTRNAAPGDADIRGAQVNASGVVVLAPFPIDASAANTLEPSVSSLTSEAPGRWLVAYARSVPPGNADLHGKLFEGDVELDAASLTQLVGSPASEVQHAPSVDCDGRSFVVAWIETAGGQRDTFLATIADVGGQLALAGAPEALGATAEDEDQVAVCAARPPPGLASRSVFAAWRVFQAVSYDVLGATYGANPFTSHCSPGVDTTIPCPCGNAPAGPGRGCRNSSNTGGGMLLALGNPDADSVVLYALFMRPNGACIILQGDQVDVVGVPFGDGVRCIDGQLLRLSLRFADPSGNVVHPGASDTPLGARNAQLGFPILPGAKRGYQVYYRDAQSFACPTTFNVTNAVQVQW
jgi:hypothetical protein